VNSLLVLKFISPIAELVIIETSLKKWSGFFRSITWSFE